MKDTVDSRYNTLYYESFILQDTMKMQSRRVYGVWDLFGDIGGIHDATFFIFASLITPFAMFLFHLKAMKELFFLTTNPAPWMKKSNKNIDVNSSN